MKNIILYETEGTGVKVDVKFENKTLWLSLNQISELFGRDKSVISRHLSNIFKEEELVRDSVVAFFATTALDGKTYQVEYFNLDAILSVGYRVNSKKGTQFRKWASRVLQEHIINGYTLNKNSLTEKKLKDLEQALELMSSTLLSHSLITDIGIDVLEIIKQYAKTWSILLEYDEGRLESANEKKESVLIDLDYREVIAQIQILKDELMAKREASELFGFEKDHSLKAIIGSISQTFGGDALYKTNFERAAHLLYFIIKDHPFSDGNKRIACFIFLMFLAKAGIILKKMPNNSMIALALLIAESNPNQKEIIINLITKLI